MCLTGDTMYRLTMTSYEIDGILELDSANQKTFTDEATHIF